MSIHIHNVLTQVSKELIFSMLTIYFLLMGLKYINGNMSTANKNIFRVFIFLPLTMAVAFNYDLYMEMIANPLNSLQAYIVQEINNIGTATQKGNNFKQLDAIFTNMWTFSNKNLWDGNLLTNTTEHIKGWFLVIVYGLLYVHIAYILIKSLVTTSIFLMIGPVPLLFFAFDGTKNITINWFKALITYWLYAPITAIFMIFVYWVGKATASDLKADFDSFFLLIVSGLVLNLLVKDIPEYANALTNSMSSGADAGGMAFQWGKVGAKVGGAQGLSMGTSAVNMFKGRVG
jgi:hypothetical protein